MMQKSQNDVLILKGHEVAALLEDRELELLQTVRHAYMAHADGSSSLPHSIFLSFPDDQKNRIIALPAYLGHEFNVAGIKWVSSFPGNLRSGMNRASAVVILNSSETGRPEVIIEGSIISAKRTAASAALAAQCLQQDQKESRLGIIGCGLINFETVRFILRACTQVNGLIVFDLDVARAQQFRDKCRSEFAGLEVKVVEDIQAVLSGSSLISIATTATQPHIYDLSLCPPGSIVLHISLRDLSPEVILSCDNVADDIDHVCRAQTSVHLAEQLIGSRDFFRCTLGDILKGRVAARKDQESLTVFSPFGLGILDLAVSKLVCDLALQQNRGTIIKSFLPDAWSDQKSEKAAF
jgi:ornithine cyclodeaminase